MEVKIFVEITFTVSEMNTFLHSMQKFKIATKNGENMIFGKKNCQMTTDTLGLKKVCPNRSILLHCRDKCVFCVLHRNSR